VRTEGVVRAFGDVNTSASANEGDTRLLEAKCADRFTLLNSCWFPLALGAVCMAPFLGLLLDGDAVASDPSGDYAALHLPLAQFAREELMAGRMPLWNPYVACGHPLHAAQQAAIFYPLATPLVLLLGANQGLKAALFAHLAICFSGTYFLARRLELSRYASGYAALVSTWSGALMGHLAEGHVSVVYQAALSPWFFLALLELLRSPGPRTSLRLAIVGSLCSLAGHPQVPYYALVAGALWSAGALAFGAAADRRQRVIAWVGCAGAVVLLVAAAQLLPAIELACDGLAESARGDGQYAGIFALDGADSARLMMPHLNGTPFALVRQFEIRDQYHERVVYFGLTVPLLAAYGLSRARTDKWQWGAAWTFVLALAVAFGYNTPAFAVLGRVVPGLLLFRCPGRIFCVATLAGALVAARGLDSLARGEARANRAGALRLATVALAAASIPAYAAIFHMPSFEWERYAQYARTDLLDSFCLWTLVACELAAVAVLGATRRLRGWKVAVLMIAVTMLDLGSFNVVNVRLESPEPRSASTLPQVDPMLRVVGTAELPRLTRLSLCYSRWAGEAIAQHRTALATNDGSVLPAATARLYKAIEADAAPGSALASCGSTWPGQRGIVQRLDNALPRFRFLRNGKAAELLSHRPIAACTDEDVRAICAATAPCVVLCGDEPRRLDLEVEAPQDGVLVVADTYYPGWFATVDGKRVKIDAAHGVFRAIALQAGKHRVAFVYDPWSFNVGLSLSGCGILALGGMVWLARRERQKAGIAIGKALFENTAR
jgi:hypothetical protein